jgi:hypothetical protein
MQILLPAILLHGTFDFVLFLMGAIQTAFNVSACCCILRLLPDQKGRTHLSCTVCLTSALRWTTWRSA